MSTELRRGKIPQELQSVGSEWDRQPRETKAAYEAFKLYRDREGVRRLVDVAAVLNRSLAAVTRWSMRWNWQLRCRAFDLDQDERESEESVRERLAMRRRQADAGRSMQELAYAGLLEIQQKADQNKPVGLTPREIAAFVHVGAALECKARGEDLPDRQFTKINVIFGDVDEAKL